MPVVCAIGVYQVLNKPISHPARSFLQGIFHEKLEISYLPAMDRDCAGLAFFTFYWEFLCCQIHSLFGNRARGRIFHTQDTDQARHPISGLVIDDHSIALSGALPSAAHPFDRPAGSPRSHAERLAAKA